MDTPFVDLPSGTVTFLFTDIEGSTNLAQQYPDALPTLLARHNAILRRAIESNHGQVFRMAGDAFCAAFHTPGDAFAAALTSQRELQHELWEPAPVRVRMGLHTGEARTRNGDSALDPYVGYLTLTRVQRVMSTAHGGQILLSDATATLLQDTLPTGVSLRDMGEHTLKGLPEPELLWQVVAPDLRSNFAPLQTLNTVPSNLPVPLSRLIGRTRELQAVRND
jgi:class 3 adenylate cyclase